MARNFPTSLPQTIHVNLLISHDDFKRANNIGKQKAAPEAKKQKVEGNLENWGVGNNTT